MIFNLPCGGVAYFDSGLYVCNKCGNPIRTKHVPKDCQEMMDKYEVLRQLGGTYWNYIKGCEAD